MKIEVTCKNIPENKGVIEEIKRATGFSDVTARLLFYRGIDSASKALRFINPGKKWLNDPFLLFGMKEAVNKIKKARDLRQNVLIFGDYDADGVCAASLLTYCLRDFGLNPMTVVPERAEGYGLNPETVLSLHGKKKIDLLITVDCGISEHDTIEKFKENGIDVVVTDHHEPPEQLPECTVIDPKIKGHDYPFDGLCGAGVAYKLGSALIGEEADKYLDIAALATVADSMDLVLENRDIVYEGLKIFNSSIRPCFKYLLGDNNKAVTATTLAFTVAPRINAGGRMGDARSALDLLMSENENEKFDLAVKLNAYNVARQSECDEIFRQAKEKLKGEDLSDKEIIVVQDENWKTGFVGIVASRLMDEYNRPVIVFGGADGALKGSARSIDGVNIHSAITAAGDLLESFGGHSQAAGLTVKKENYGALKERLNSFLKENYGECAEEKTLFVDAEIDGAFPISVAKEIERLEPFGTGNKKPLFLTETEGLKVSPLKIGSPHYSFKISDFEILDFNGEKDVLTLSAPVKKKIVYELSLSVFKGREYLKGYLKHVAIEKLNSYVSELYFFENEIKKLLKDGKSEAEVRSIDEITIDKKGHGTVFAISDTENLKYYENLKDLTIHTFYVGGKTRENVVLVSPSEMPEGYDRIVYLDEPMQFVNTEKESYCNFDLSGYDALEHVSTDRADMIEVFNTMNGYVGKEYGGSAAAFYKYKPDTEMHQFVFGAEVFTELGFFNVKNGILYRDKSVKSPLENSVIYGKVFEIRG